MMASLCEKTHFVCGSASFYIAGHVPWTTLSLVSQAAKKLPVMITECIQHQYILFLDSGLHYLLKKFHCFAFV